MSSYVRWVALVVVVALLPSVAEAREQERVRVVVSVVDANGAPVSQIPVRIYPDGDGTGVKAETGSDGTFSVDLLPDTYQLHETSERWSIARGGTLSVKAGAPAQHRVRAVHSAKVGGRLVDRAGRPIAGVNADLTGTYGQVAIGAVTDANGSWSYSDMPPASYGVMVYGGDRTWFIGRPVSLSAAAGQTLRRDVVVDRGSRVTGRLVDPAGRPIADATYWVVWFDRDGNERGRGQQRVEPDGTFDIPSLPLRTYQLLIGAPGRDYRWASAPGYRSPVLYKPSEGQHLQLGDVRVLDRAPASLAAPRILAAPRVGAPVRVDPGRWDAEGVRLSYQWLRGGRPVRGATSSTFTPRPGDLGASLRVAVSAQRDGSARRTLSTKGRTVQRGHLARTLGPTVSGRSSVGKRLTASPGTWSPAAQSLRYQWRLDGRAIAGATTSRLLLTPRMRGRMVSVSVTARRGGYAPSTSGSTPVRVRSRR